jgi:opacity protein-like surface antigen
MRKLLLATTCAIGVCAPLKASLAGPVFNWTGCYIGGNAGGGWGRKNLSDDSFTSGESSPVADIDGWLAGGQVGCIYQFAPQWVVGIEGMGDWANFSGRSDPFFDGKAVFQARTDWIASATGRLGYAVDQWLFFVRGGAAWVGDKYKLSGTFLGDPFDYRGSETRSGWTLGGGIEWAFAPNWSLKVEYAYYDFGTGSLTLVDRFGGDPDPASIRQRIQTVTFGFNYHFSTGTP